MFDKDGATAEGEGVPFGEDAQACGLGVGGAEEEVAVAVLVVQRARQRGEGGGDVLLVGGGEVVAEPVVVEVAEDVDGFGVAGEGGEGCKEGRGDFRPVFCEVDVGEEVGGHGFGRAISAALGGL